MLSFRWRDILNFIFCYYREEIRTTSTLADEKMDRATTVLVVVIAMAPVLIIAMQRAMSKARVRQKKGFLPNFQKFLK